MSRRGLRSLRPELNLGIGSPMALPELPRAVKGERLIEDGSKGEEVEIMIAL